jgi:dolichyl-phosphate-mannose--protein O-mannosyl transferase
MYYIGLDIYNVVSVMCVFFIIFKASTRENQGVWVTSSIYKGKSGGLVASTRVNQEVWGTGSIYKGKSGGLDDR